MASTDIKNSQIVRQEGEKSAKFSSKSSSDKSDAQNSKMTDKKSKTEGQAEAVEFNLSDPELLSRQLDRVDLTEEESDELLREAYKVNKRLKMMLKQKQDKVAASLRSQSASSAASHGQRPRGSSGSGSILPPIKGRSGGGAGLPARSQKAYGQSLGRSSGNSSAAGSKPQSKTKKASSPPQRQDWDDRFSYS